jgi:alpha,alpha-trehalase
VLPRVGWSKGECARFIRQRVERASARPLMAVYIGDDWTDEQAFEALSGQALTIRVAEDAGVSRAECRLADVAAVHALLADLAALVRVPSGT